MHRQIDSGLDELKEKLITMSGYVEEAVDLAIRTWKDRDPSLIAKVQAVEEKVNAAHKEVDAVCFKLLATQQPLAQDLRVILSAVKINSDLERMVDQAVNIAQNSRFYLKSPPLPDCNDLIQMSDAVKHMVRGAIDSFVKCNATLAKDVLEEDDRVDDFKDKIFKDVLEYVKGSPSEIEQGLNVILIARNLERIGDHSTNVAEDVIFTESGRDVRHPSIASKPKGGK